MGRFNTKNHVTANKATNKIDTTGERISTFEGGTGWKRTPKAELFLAAVTSLNEDTFYEKADARADRIAGLVKQVADDNVWLEGMIGWLRQEAGLRAVPAMIAAEAVHARLEAGLTGGNRALVSAAIGRLDESSEFLAYWFARFGRKVPSAVKRGIADALNKSVTENSVLKWQGRMARGAFTLADVVNLTHPKPSDKYRENLFGAIIDSAYGREPNLEELSIMAARRDFLNLTKDEKIKVLSDKETADRIIKDARLTHEVIAGTIGAIPTEVWDNLIDHMGYQALRMNLNRISNAGVSYDTIEKINRKLRDTEAITRAKTMPINFLSAYRNAPLDFAAALQAGANSVLDNVPELPGRTLLLLDRSGSMGSRLSERSSLSRQDAANMFAAAFALKNKGRVDVVAFDTQVEKVKITSNDLLRVVDNDMPSARGGTDTAKALRESYNGHDRILIISDEQSLGARKWWGSEYTVDEVLDERVPAHVNVFTWNLAGYEAAHMEAKERRWSLGGLTDKGFELIPLLERGTSAGWPWENKG